MLCGAAGPGQLPFGAELLLVGPFLVGLVLSWAAFYTAERTAAETGRLGQSRPFGGRAGSDSGLGRVGGAHPMEAFTELQTVIIA